MNGGRRRRRSIAIVIGRILVDSNDPMKARAKPMATQALRQGASRLPVVKFSEQASVIGFSEMPFIQYVRNFSSGQKQLP